MATLKQIATRLKSVQNIQKITTSMKMVSAAKFKRAEENLKAVKPIGDAAQALRERGNVALQEDPKKKLMVTVSSDRGLCGGIHSGLVRKIRDEVINMPGGQDFQIATVGDKTRGAFVRQFPEYLKLSANEVGRTPPTFAEASFFSQKLLDSGYEPDDVVIYFNKFVSAMSSKVTALKVNSSDSLYGQEALDVYDDVDAETLQGYQEFNLAANVYYAMVEGQASEQSSRRAAMEGASKNAGEMIDSLQLQYNRTRQSVITRELIEIISGAAALD